MNKFLKIFFLVIMLAIPLGIFIFLRIFGDNKFDIPVYYSEGLEDEVTNCSYKGGQFVVPDSLIAGKGPSVVLFFLEESDFNAITLDNHGRRLDDIFGEEIPEIFVYAEQSAALQEPNMQIRLLPKESLKQIMQCGFILKDFNKYVLVDGKNRIRGYYGTELEEVDRLIVEIKILLENGADR
ncbi:MAG: hypothetical protein WD555_02435 [Fulvivirga sp.]